MQDRVYSRADTFLPSESGEQQQQQFKHSDLRMNKLILLYKFSLNFHLNCLAISGSAQLVKLCIPL